MRTRWALSYLRGPLTLAEIGRLQAGRRQQSRASAAARPTCVAQVRPAQQRASLRRRVEQAQASAVACQSRRRRTAHSPAGHRGEIPAGSTGGERALPSHAWVHWCARISSTRRPASTTGKPAYYLAPVSAADPIGPRPRLSRPARLHPATHRRQTRRMAKFPAPRSRRAITRRRRSRSGGARLSHGLAEIFSAARALKLTAAPGASENEFRAQVRAVAA